jgi:uncharacterized protein YqgC (DUF456 family)
VDLADQQANVTLLCGLAILVGIFGVIVPMLPGLPLCWLGVAAWVLLSDAGWGKWMVLGIATVVTLAGMAAKYAWPGRRLQQGGVPTLSLTAGVLLGIAGFFVIPVVGLVFGFILGIWLAEWLRLRQGRPAWTSTKQALKAVGLSMLIELAAALTIGVTWLIGIAATT